MLLYLMIGLGLFYIFLEPEIFFSHLADSVANVKDEHPDLNEKYIHIGMSTVIILFWILWPIFFSFVLIAESRND